MALPAVLVSMITVTNTAAGIIGTIKRRCGASQAIVELTSKCAELVVKIRKLLKTLEGSAEVPHDTRAISTALNLRRDEFDAILKNLDRVNRRTKRTHPVDRTEKFILAQGWAKKMESIHSDLANVRDGIETIVSSWDVGQFVVTKVVEEIVTIDVTKREELGRGPGRSDEQGKSAVLGCETVDYVDQYLITMVKLTDAQKAALNRYGDLDKLALPDALYRAWENSLDIDETCAIQLLQRSAELLHPDANSWMGLYRKWGSNGVEKNIDLAVSHYRFASSLGDVYSSLELMKYFDCENDRKNLLKYFKMASKMEMHVENWIYYAQFAIENKFESDYVGQPLIETDQYKIALQESICHFFGLGVPRSNAKAVDAVHPIDSSSYYVQIDDEDIHPFCIGGTIIPWYTLRFYHIQKPSALRCYADFLFKKNQFLPFLLLSSGSVMYSSRKWEEYALHAASSHCVDAHIFLAEYYARNIHTSKRDMKQHLRIAADEGNGHAQFACRHLFGRNTSVSKKVRRVEETSDANQRKQKDRGHRNHTERVKEDSQRK